MVSALQKKVQSQGLAWDPLSIWDPSLQTLFPRINTDTWTPFYLFSSKQEEFLGLVDDL